MYYMCSVCIHSYVCCTTVVVLYRLVQIFEGHIFCGCHKFSCFAILFLRITGFRFVGTVMRYIFEDLIFVDHMLSVKTAKFTSLENLYEYGMYMATSCMCVCMCVFYILTIIHYMIITVKYHSLVTVINVPDTPS